MSSLNPQLMSLPEHGTAGEEPGAHLQAESESLMCLQVNTAAMRVACSIHGLRPPVKGVPKTVAVLVPGTGELALAGEGALLQIFDPSRNRHIDKVQVRCSSNSSLHPPCMRALSGLAHDTFREVSNILRQGAVKAV